MYIVQIISVCEVNLCHLHLKWPDIQIKVNCFNAQPCIITKYSVNPFPVEPLFWQEERAHILALSLDGVPDSCKRFLKPDTKYFLSFFHSAFIFRLIYVFEFINAVFFPEILIFIEYILMYVQFKEKKIKLKTYENQPCGLFCILLTYLLFISLIQSTVCLVIWWWVEFENRKFVSDGFDYCVFIKMQEKNDE